MTIDYCNNWLFSIISGEISWPSCCIFHEYAWTQRFYSKSCWHNDVMTEMLSALLALGVSLPPITGGFILHRSSYAELWLSLLLAWPSSWTNNWITSDLRCSCDISATGITNRIIGKGFYKWCQLVYMPDISFPIYNEILTYEFVWYPMDFELRRNLKEEKLRSFVFLGQILNSEQQ